MEAASNLTRQHSLVFIIRQHSWLYFFAHNPLTLQLLCNIFLITLPSTEILFHFVSSSQTPYHDAHCCWHSQTHIELKRTSISVCQAQLAGLHLQITVGKVSGSREGSTAPSPPPNLGFEEPSSSSSGKLWPVAWVNELDTLRPTLLESLSGNQVSMGQGHVFRFTRKHSSHSLTLLHAMKPARPLHRTSLPNSQTKMWTRSWAV